MHHRPFITNSTRPRCGHEHLIIVSLTCGSERAPVSAARLYRRCEAFAGQEVAQAERGVQHELLYDAGSGIELEDEEIRTVEIVAGGAHG
jgi:hypothetical protein